MGKKKPFIDKKNSSTYHIVRRSQRDVGGYYDESTGEINDMPSQFLLVPTPDTLKKNKDQQQHASFLTEEQQQQQQQPQPSGGGNKLLTTMKSKLGEAGLLLEDEEYNYEHHMKPITGSGVYFSVGDKNRGGGRMDNRAALADARAKSVPLNDDINELDRNFDSIALSQDCMDSDIAAALFGDFEEGNFEEILDDFCITANEEPQYNEYDNEQTNDDFDFDAHIQGLINKAKKEEGSSKDVRQIDDDFFSGKKVLKNKNKYEHNLHDEEEVEDDDSLDGHNVVEVTPGVVAKLNVDEERALVEKFEAALAEYDSDEVGDLDKDCMYIGGDVPLEGDKKLESVFDDFLTEKRDEIFIEGTAHLPENRRVGGSGFATLVGKRMVPSKGLKNAEQEEEEIVLEEEDKIEQVLAAADQILANPEMDLPPEEVFIDGKSYFTVKSANPWDCESILSTYSNLDNNPAVIGRSKRSRKKKNKNSLMEGDIPEDQPAALAQIRLSNKTGLPIFSKNYENNSNNINNNLLQSYYTDDDTLASVNKGLARRKNETKEEKKARKQAVKQEKQIAKFQKKIMKQAFAEEFDRRSSNVIGNDIAGKSVFKYS